MKIRHLRDVFYFIGYEKRFHNLRVGLVFFMFLWSIRRAIHPN